MNRIIRTTVAADEINRQEAAGLMPSGHISAGYLSTPDEVV